MFRRNVSESVVRVAEKGRIKPQFGMKGYLYHLLIDTSAEWLLPH
jgi:hypothetical protein